MVVVNRKKGETKDSLFRKFSRAFMDEDIITEARKKLFYKKPSLRRKDEEKERIQKRSRRRMLGKNAKNSRFPFRPGR